MCCVCRQAKINFISPRHFLDFLQHYTHLFNEKRADLEEQQLHLNIGLKKLADTREQVKDLNASLTQTVRNRLAHRGDVEENLTWPAGGGGDYQ